MFIYCHEHNNKWKISTAVAIKNHNVSFATKGRDRKSDL